MAAYGAVVSLMQILNRTIQQPPINGFRIFQNKRRQLQLQTLWEKVVFFQDFLENLDSQKIRKMVVTESVERKIRDAVYAAEDHIESHLSDYLLSETETKRFEFRLRVPISLPFLAILLLIFIVVRRVMHASFQKFIAVAVKMLMPPVMGQTLILTTFYDLMFFLVQLLIPFVFHILIPVLVLNMISVWLPNLIRVALRKGISVVAQYAQYNFGPEDQDLRQVIEGMDSIVKEVIRINGVGAGEDLLTPTAASSARSNSVGGGIKNVVIGFDNDLEQIKTRLVENSSKVDVVSIVGMGGIGKTVLARQVYDDAYIVYHFDIRSWVTVSQEYSLRQVLVGILGCAKFLTEEMLIESDERLAEYLHKCLKGRRFLIVMDDVWDIEIWDAVKRLFPDDCNGSRILLSTRLSYVALNANSLSPPHKMSFLNEDDSWILLCKKIFAEEDCPPQLREIGKEIARKCGGLPLAIVVIGGLLYKNSRTLEYWGNLAENLNSVVTINDEQQCLEILSLSYDHLPHHLRACFLYMGVFPEDCEIPIVKLISLWVAEGFLKPDSSKNLEEIAEEYLKDLIERSLILVCKWSSYGEIKTCNIHDLLRDLCVRNARNENFLQVVKCYDELLELGTNLWYRLSIHPNALSAKQINSSMHSISLVRSLLCTGVELTCSSHFYLGFRLLRVLDVVIVRFSEFPADIIKLINLRYLAFTYGGPLPPSISKLCNLETIVHHNWTSEPCSILPEEIWMMPKLRHLWLTPSHLPDPFGAHIDENSSFLLENLQTLLEVRDLRCSKAILGRVPNLKTLVVSYVFTHSTPWSAYELEGLVNLHRLETLKFLVSNYLYMCDNPFPIPAPKLAFPQNLKKLTLSLCGIPWKNMTAVGMLPNLEVLKLKLKACQGQVWKPIEGEFLKLKCLVLEEIDFVHWRADYTHFPRLEFLSIRYCLRLKKVPSSIGEISTLQRIELVKCRPSAANSVKRILMKQQNLGNGNLDVRFDRSKWFKDLYFNPRSFRSERILKLYTESALV